MLDKDPKSSQDIVKVACVNFESIADDKAANLDKIKAITVKAAEQGVNIILFPEMALTSFGAVSPERAPSLAETVPGPATDVIQKVTAQYGIYVCFGLIEREGGKLFNSAAFIGPKGVMGSYRKIHTLGADPWQKEESRERWAARGDKYPLFETPWGPVGVSICYDTYCFPEVARTYAVKGARLLLHATFQPEFPNAAGCVDFYNTMLGARAIENNVFIASANSWGKQGLIQSIGRSSIFGPKPGQMNYHIYAGPAANKNEIVMAELDLASLKNLPVGIKSILKDRRPETYLPPVFGLLSSPSLYKREVRRDFST